MSDEQRTLRETTGQGGTVALSSAAIDLSQSGPQSQDKQYPAMPKQPVPGKDKAPDFAAYGADGVTIFSGIIDVLSTGEYNPDFDWQKAIEIYDTMRRNDAQIAMLLRLVEMPIIRAKWSIKPGEGDTDQSTEIASFIDECLFKSMCYTTRAGRQAYQTWPNILHHILMMIAYGFSPFEVCYKKEDGWVKWARWTPLLPRTLYRWWVDEGNDLTGIQIWTWINYVKQYINIPADKLLLFVNEQEGNNFNGVSMLRAAYKHWYYKDRYYAIEAIGVERAAVQPPVIRLSPNPTAEEQALAQELVQNIRVNEQMGLVLKHDMDAEILKGSQRQAFQTQPIIQHHDMLMARAFLAQFANLGSNETGSYALAQSQVQMFLASFQSVIDNICSVINREIRRLVIWNYGEQENYPELVASKLIAQDITTLTDAWKSLQTGNAPLITPSPELEEHMLDLLGLPISKTHTVATRNPSSPTTPDRPDQNPQDHGDDEPDIQKQMREATEESRLLREALGHLDAVERGMQFFNPYHLPPGPGGGQFAPRGGGGSGGGEGEHIGTGRMGRGGIPGVTHVGHHEDGQGGGSHNDELERIRAQQREGVERAFRGVTARSIADMRSTYGDEHLAEHLREFTPKILRATAKEEGIPVHGRSKEELIRSITDHLGITKAEEGASGGSKGEAEESGVKIVQSEMARQFEISSRLQVREGFTAAKRTEQMFDAFNGLGEHNLKVANNQYGSKQLADFIYSYSPTGGMRYLQGFAKQYGIDPKGMSREEIARAIADKYLSTHEHIDGPESHMGEVVVAKRANTGEDTTSGRRGKGEDVSKSTTDTISRAEHERAIADLKAQHQAEMDELRRQVEELRSGRKGSGEETTGRGPNTRDHQAITRSIQDDLVAVRTGVVNPWQRGGFDPTLPPNPSYLRDLYGDHQLHAALDRYGHARLKETVARLQQDGYAVKAGRNKEETIQHLMAHARNPVKRSEDDEAPKPRRRSKKGKGQG